MYTPVLHKCSAGHVFKKLPSVMVLAPSCPCCPTPYQKEKSKLLVPIFEGLGYEILEAYRSPNKQGGMLRVRCTRCLRTSKTALRATVRQCKCKKVAVVTANGKDQRPRKMPSPRNAPLADRERVFRQNLALLHGGRIELVSKYKGSGATSRFRHTCGSRWWSTPTNVLSSKVGCPKCGREQAHDRTRKSHLQYYKECLERTGTVIPIEKYAGDAIAIKHKCLCGSVFTWRPCDVRGRKVGKRPRVCAVCNKTSVGAYSPAALRWLEEMRTSTGQRIQDALHGGERRLVIQGKEIRVDGYCVRTRTVYEYLGNVWHGAPHSTFHPGWKPPREGMPGAKTLFAKTMRRFHAIASTGRRVVWVWEDHYHRGYSLSGVLEAIRC